MNTLCPSIADITHALAIVKLNVLLREVDSLSLVHALRLSGLANTDHGC